MTQLSEEKERFVNHVVLVGQMGAGKSTVGKMVAVELGLEFVDLDEAIQAHTKMRIPQLFSQYGQAGFRELEAQVLASELCSSRPKIIAAGGGTPCFHNGMSVMKSAAITVFIDAEPAVLLTRISDSDRPLIQGKKADELHAFLVAQRNERLADYQRADMWVQGEQTPVAVSQQILAKLKQIPLETRLSPDDVVVDVALAERSYPIVFSHDSLERMLHRHWWRARVSPQSSLALISDDNVARLYLSQVQVALERFGHRVVSIIVPAGEQSKSFATYEEVCGACLKAQLNRKDTVVALGGGVVGDLAGFVAATLFRGIDYVQIPTTILSQVDSSVGGKTAINHTLGKNLIGAFWQPKAVFACQTTLQTLAQEQVISGQVEALKHAIIADYHLFCEFESRHAAIMAGEGDVVVNWLSKSVAIKAEVVAGDEREQGRRAILNFGHTFGHAFETLSSPRLAHGYAVALGMVVALDISVKLGRLTQSTQARMLRVLAHLSIDLDVSKWLIDPELLSVMQHDKKSDGDSVRFVVLSDIGQAELVSLSWLALKAYIEDPQMDDARFCELAKTGKAS